LKAVEILEKLTPELDKEINTILDNEPEKDMDWRDFKPFPGRRETVVNASSK
jgi:hypothetical protein